MNIIISGYTGFLGSHLIKVLKKNNSVTKLNLRNFKNYEKKKNFNFLKKKFKKKSILINCASSLKPRNNQDLFLNSKLPKIFFDLTKKNKMKFVHISTINSLIKERQDEYSISKRKGELQVNDPNFAIVRLSLVIKKKKGIYLPEGELRKFFVYLNFFTLPIYPFIYPGAMYRPIDIDYVCKKISILIKKKKLKTVNIQGNKTISSYELFKDICNQNNKYCFKISTLWLKKFVPNFIKNILYRSNLFQQVLNIKTYV